MKWPLACNLFLRSLLTCANGIEINRVYTVFDMVIAIINWLGVSFTMRNLQLIFINTCICHAVYFKRNSVFEVIL